MTQILDNLFIKRFCLPSGSDVSSYEIGMGNSNISKCLCGDYNHVSCILQGKREYEQG